MPSGCIDLRVFLQALRTQLEYYFCPLNLLNDTFLRQKMAEEKNGWVKASVVISFTRMASLFKEQFPERNLTMKKKTSLVRKALSHSPVVRIERGMLKPKRRRQSDDTKFLYVQGVSVQRVREELARMDLKEAEILERKGWCMIHFSRLKREVIRQAKVNLQQAIKDLPNMKVLDHREFNAMQRVYEQLAGELAFMLQHTRKSKLQTSQ